MSGPEVSVRKQGGGWVPGVAIGRLGRQLLVRYQITSGEQRERFLQPHRVQLPDGSSLEGSALESLPRWRRRKCQSAACAPAWHYGDGPHSHLEEVPS